MLVALQEVYGQGEAFTLEGVRKMAPNAMAARTASIHQRLLATPVCVEVQRMVSDLRTAMAKRGFHDAPLQCRRLRTPNCRR